MKKKLFFRLILFAALVCVTASGCGSSSTSDLSINVKMITSDEGAFITRDDVLNDNITIIDTENSEVIRDSSGESYRFATRYEEVGSQTSVEVIDPSRHRFLFVFVSPISGNRDYEFVSGVDFLDQVLKMYVSYDSPELHCVEGCANVYNYSASGNAGYYKVTVLENGDDYLEFVFRIWNSNFLDLSDVSAEEERGTVFQGRIKIKKTLHTDSENYYHREEDD